LAANLIAFEFDESLKFSEVLVRSLVGTTVKLIAIALLRSAAGRSF
jgi:hypothetical protein